MVSGTFFCTEQQSLTPDGGSTVHVLRRVLEQAVAPVVIFHVKQRDGLEAAPAQGEDQRILRLQDPLIPSVFL